MSRIRPRGSSAMHSKTAPWLVRKANGATGAILAKALSGNAIRDSYVVYSAGMPRLDPPQFRTEEVAIGTAAMVMLHGELDIAWEKKVVADFGRALDRHPTALAADLRGLSFMDSTGAH